MANYLKDFLVGATVRISARASVPGGTAVPGVASRVFISHIRRDGDTADVDLLLDADLVDGGAGEWYVFFETSGLPPGTYRYQVTAVDAGGRSALVEDFFVLRPAMS